MSYVDGFVIVVPKKKIAAYKKMALPGKKIWMEHGALQYFECAGDDLNVEWGLPFPKLTKMKKNETVFFSFVIYKSRKHRDAVNKKVMADKRLKMDMNDMPFDMKRFSFGGFKAVIEG